MVDAATHALQNASACALYLRVAERRGPKIARVAVARRLPTLAYYVLRDEGGCRAFPVPTRSVSGRVRSPLVMASTR